MRGFGNRDMHMQGRKIASAAATVAGLVMLGGCTSPQRITPQNINPVQYASASEALKGSPALRRAELQNCVAKARRFGPREIESVRLVMNLPTRQDVPTTYCQRAIAAVASGRLTYADYQAVRANQITPKLIRVIQGR
jgi:hypothetical protein